MDDAIRIAIVDDHPFFREGVERALRRISKIRLVAQGANADDACRIASEEQPDIMLLDISMPGSGINAARQITSANTSVKILMLTGSDDDELVATALKVGASGYLLKGANTAELIEAITTVHNGKPYITPTLSSRVLVQRMRSRQPDGGATVRARLTEREQQMLDYASQGLTNSEIAARCNLALPTIKNCMSRIFQKLQVRNRAEAIAVRAQD